MKQNLIILVSLLVAFSFVSAIPLHKRATTFSPCASGSPTVLSVTIQPDPPTPSSTLLFTISGTAATEIDPGSTFVMMLLDSTNTVINPPEPVVQDLCSVPGFTCPVAVGTSFTAMGQLPLPATLPSSYEIGIVILAPDNTTTIACSAGPVTSS